MSTYTSNDWTCKIADKSPINLSQSIAKPCDSLCEFSMETNLVREGIVANTPFGLYLSDRETGLGNCKYNGEGYNCKQLIISHPSHHTVENIQADAEVIAMFSNPSGKKLWVSSLIKANTNQSVSTEFFNSFVPFVKQEKRADTGVKFSEGWNLNMMVPTNSAYFVYDGSTLGPNCEKTKWIVFKTMINMDTNDFALLVKNAEAGSQPIQALGDREVFFNSTDKLSGTPAEKGTFRIYKLKEGQLTPIENLKSPTNVPPVTKPDVKSSVSSESSTLNSITSYTSKQLEINGILSFFDVVLMVVALYYGYVYGKKIEYRAYGIYLINLGQYFGALVNTILFRQRVTPV